MGPKILTCAAVAALLGCGGNAASRVPDADSTAAVRDTTPVVLFLGTSLTAGLGLEEEQAYPALLQQEIDSAGLHFRVANAGVSGETSAGGLRRLDWLLNQNVAVLVLELGANDALRGQDLEATRRNLQQIMDQTRKRHPGVAIVIAGMQAPPNLGQQYTREFRELFPDLARTKHTALIPFLLDSVAAIPSLNQRDGIHPTAEGDQIVARNVWRVLEPVLRGRSGEEGRGKREE